MKRKPAAVTNALFFADWRGQRPELPIASNLMRQPVWCTHHFWILFDAFGPQFKNLALALIISLGFFGGHAFGATLNVTKTITWTHDNELLGFPAGGTFTYEVKSSASEVKHAIVVPDPKKGTGKWDVLKGLDPTSISVSTKPDGHAQGVASIQFQAYKTVGPQTTGIMTINDRATTVRPSSHGDNSAYASSEGTMSIAGEAVKKRVTVRDKEKVSFVPQVAIETVALKGDSTGAYSDPVSVTYTDLSTGESIITPLFHLDVNAANGGTLNWDQSGVQMSLGDNDSTVAMHFNVLSRWVSDPALVDSSLTLDKTGLHTSGIFSTLPWVVSGSSVSLAGGYLDSIDVLYDIPDSQLLEGHFYIPTLNMDQQGVVMESVAEVPEPANWTMISAGMLVIWSRRRSRVLRFH